MIDKKQLGFMGLFSERGSLKEAMNYMEQALETAAAGPDKVHMMTAAFVLSNTFAHLSTCLANTLEMNVRYGGRVMLADGTDLISLTFDEFLQRYEFPFEAELLMVDLKGLDIPTTSPKPLALDAFLALKDSLQRMYFLMAVPKQFGVGTIKNEP